MKIKHLAGRGMVSLLLGLVILFSACHGTDLDSDSASQFTSDDLGIAQVLNIRLTDEGVYRVPLSDLGWSDQDPNLIQLSNRGQQLPILIQGNGSAPSLVFYGQPTISSYTNENVYQLTAGVDPGLRMLEMRSDDDLELAGTGSITSTLLLEENNHYSPLVAEGDHWFWAKIIAPKVHPLEFTVENLASGRAWVRVEFWGNTEAIPYPDHRTLIRLNGEILADQTWDGQNRYTLESLIPEGLLTDGPNILEIEAPGTTEAPIDIAFLDWVEITYPRVPEFSSDSFPFAAANAPVHLSGLGGGDLIFDITAPESVSVYTVSGESSLFQGEPGHRYLPVVEMHYLQPDSIEPANLTPDLKDPTVGASYIAIGQPELLDPLSPLLDFRVSQGLSVLSIPVSTVYDQFNGGIPEPEAIQDFLTYAGANWHTPPAYVLLVGDASYDYRDYLGSGTVNQVPTIMIQTAFGGETGSDVLIADINQDPWPDIPIGRLPARTAAEVEVYVEKVLHYEDQKRTSGGEISVLAVADGQEDRFQLDAQNFLNLFPKGVQSTLIAPEENTETVDRDVVDAIQHGYTITAYFGHGSLNMWGKDRLFSIEDSANLSNIEQLPIMLHITCLTGLFTHPTQQSLTESLLWQPDGGAIAVLAPTSLTLPTAQEHLTSAFVTAFLDPQKNTRLGDVVLYAWRQVPVESNDAADVMHTFLLFGDPALSLPLHP